MVYGMDKTDKTWSMEIPATFARGPGARSRRHGRPFGTHRTQRGMSALKKKGLTSGQFTVLTIGKSASWSGNHRKMMVISTDGRIP